jgi:hypothetical protein
MSRRAFVQLALALPSGRLVCKRLVFISEYATCVYKHIVALAVCRTESPGVLTLRVKLDVSK